ncbi:MAG: hypothetical protein O3A85_03125 [Proteobacteria bacterium]|nr:hypothetical protein [Pseudomonadota bacterium]
MSNMIRDMLNNSRIEVEENAIDNVELSEVVQDVMDDLSSEIEMSNARITVPQNLPSVRGTPSRVYQV